MQCEEVRRYYDILAKKRVSLVFKRLFDIVVSFLMLVVLSPVFLIIAVAVAADSRGGVFFTQTRITAYGKRFRIYKFRTMIPNAEAVGAGVTVSNDMRVTGIGKILRKCRLDELPQLINILAGDMTYVGTRPEIPQFVDRYTPAMLATLLLPAGVTSDASIYYKDESALLDSSEDTDKTYTEDILPGKMYYNLKGIENFGFFRDIAVMIKTVLAVCGAEYKGDYVPESKTPVGEDGMVHK